LGFSIHCKCLVLEQNRSSFARQFFPYITSPATALSAKANADGTDFTYVRDPYTPGPIIAAASKPNTVCMVFAASASGEEIDSVDDNIGDRNNITSWQGADEVVNTVASRCSNTGEPVSYFGTWSMLISIGDQSSSFTPLDLFLCLGPTTRMSLRSFTLVYQVCVS